LVFNGSDAAENIDFSANGNRVRLTRDVGSVAMDLVGLETIDVNTFGGADTINVNALTGTDLTVVDLNLNNSAGSGDGQADSVIVNGTEGNDHIQVLPTGNGTGVVAAVNFLLFVRITGAESTSDTLTVNALGGDDMVDASLLPANLIGLELNGGAGSDRIFGSQGDDTFVWNSGDGGDTIDGQAGLDKLTFNGSDTAENIAIAGNGSRVRLTSDSDVGNVTMDLNAVDGIELNAGGGADSITVNDLTGTGLVKVQLNLNGPAGGGDGQTDNVGVNGTDGDDTIHVAAAGNTILVDGLFPTVRINGSDGTTDHLTINALDGDDTVDASSLPANRIALVVNGGAGNDSILGSEGPDFVNGGAGDDTVALGDGDDTFVWNPGDGSDSVDGQGGDDRLVFNGSAESETFGLSANGNRVQLTRDIGGVAMDLTGVEEVDCHALGGADTINVNDLSGTGLSAVNLDLAGTGGSGDGQADSVIVNGTEGNDNIQVLSGGNGMSIFVAGLFPSVNITGAEATNDQLTVNALGGDDVVDAASLPANLIGLTLNGGAGNNVILTTMATISIRSSLPTSTYGELVSFTATVDPPSGGPSPTGSVQFVVDGANFGAPVSLVGGIATSDALGNLAAGSHTILARYSGDGHYGANTDGLTQAVNKAHLTVAADPKSKRYGEAIPALTATISGFVNGDGPDVVSGSPGLTTPATSASGVGTYAIVVSAATLAAANYDFPNLVDGTLIINKATPTITWSNPADIIFGTPLGPAQLDATVSATGPDPTTGALMYSPAPGTVLRAGAGQTLTVTAAATANYEAVSMSVTINVLKATPTITWLQPADITVGTPLGPAQLDAAASIPGTVAYSPAAGAILDAGRDRVLTATFTPADSTDYNSVAITTTINVLNATSPSPPHAMGIVRANHTKKGLISITVAFDEALNPELVNNPGLYSVRGGVKKQGKTVHGKNVLIRAVNYDDTAHTVTINLARPSKGIVQVTILPGVVAVNGGSSSSRFTALVK
jgi:hypothetical protein